MIFKKTENTKYLIWFWSIFAGSMLCLAVFFVLLSSGALGFMPTFEELENPKSNLATDVISADDVVLGKIFQENRSQVDYDDLSPYLVKALVSTEDERFFEHSGVDVRSLGRVLVRTVMMRDESSGGGSTITQQLAKNICFDQDKRLTRKAAEMFAAFALEHNYSKDEIFELYVNSIYFGNGWYCVHDAAKGYFGVEPGEMTDYQCTELACYPNAPSIFMEEENEEALEARRQAVLERMVRYGYLTEQEAEALR